MPRTGTETPRTHQSVAQGDSCAEAAVGRATPTKIAHSQGGDPISQDEYIAPVSQLPVGTVTGVDGMAVGNNGAHFAVSRRCRHLGGDIGEGSIDSDGCLVCPWHSAAYDVESGRMTKGPGGGFAKVPGLGAAFKLLTWAVPLRRRRVVERDGDLYLQRPY